jgi:hypothetical protein
VLCVTAVAQNDTTLTAHAPIYITHVMVIDTETGREAPISRAISRSDLPINARA